MNEFTASNGVSITIETTNAGTYLVGKKDREVPTRGVYADTHATGSVEGIAALREFFRAEEDERLGRWRDPRHPEFVVRIEPDYDGDWIVTNEATAERAWISSDEDVASWSYKNEPGADAIREIREAFLASRVELKPWYDAQPGEVWLLNIDGEDVAAIRDVDEDFVTHRAGYRVVRNSESIAAGRRIWPEVAS